MSQDTKLRIAIGLQLAGLALEAAPLIHFSPATFYRKAGQR